MPLTAEQIARLVVAEVGGTRKLERAIEDARRLGAHAVMEGRTLGVCHMDLLTAGLLADRLVDYRDPHQGVTAEYDYISLERVAEQLKVRQVRGR